MKYIGIALVKLYRSLFFLRYFFSIVPGGQSCAFYPSCSNYAQTAIKKYGLFKGCYLSIKRLGKCHPWHSCYKHDPVPEEFKW